MIVAYLMAMVIGVNPATVAPEVVRPYTSVDACISEAEKRNQGSSLAPSTIIEGKVYYCVRVLYPV